MDDKIIELRQNQYDDLIEQIEKLQKQVDKAKRIIDSELKGCYYCKCDECENCIENGGNESNFKLADEYNLEVIEE